MSYVRSDDDPVISRVAELIKDLSGSGHLKHVSTTGFAEPGYITGHTGIIVVAAWKDLPNAFKPYRDALENFGVRTEDDQWSQCVYCKRLFLAVPDGWNWTPHGMLRTCEKCLDDDPDKLNEAILKVNEDHTPVVPFDSKSFGTLGYVKIGSWIINDHASSKHTPCPNVASNLLRKSFVDKFFFVPRYKKRLSCSFDVYVHSDNVKNVDGMFWTEAGGFKQETILTTGKLSPTAILRKLLFEGLREFESRTNLASAKNATVNTYFAGDKIISDRIPHSCDDFRPIGASHKLLWTPWEANYFVVDNACFPPFIDPVFCRMPVNRLDLGFSGWSSLIQEQYDQGTRQKISVDGQQGRLFQFTDELGSPKRRCVEYAGGFLGKVYDSNAFNKNPSSSGPCARYSALYRR